MLPTDGADDTLHADLEAAFDNAAAAEPARAETVSAPVTEVAGKTGASEATAPAKTPAAPATPDVKVDAKGKFHGDGGKFVSKDAAAATPAAKTTAAPGLKTGTAPTPIPSTDATKASTEQPSTAADAPPVGWTADAKTEWATLSPAIKAAVLKREVEMSAGGRQWSEEKRRYEEVIAPVRQAASRRGISEAEGIQRLMAAQDRLDRDPVGAIQWLAQSYNVPITVNGQTDPINGQPTADVSSRIESPARAPSDPRLDALWQRVQDQERRETEMTVQKVTAFATAPEHPYFDALESEIMALLPVLKRGNPTFSPDELLQYAYDSAVWANKETRRALQAEQAAAAAATNGATRAAEVAKAKLASLSLRPGAPAGVPAAPPRDSIREEILAAMGS